MYLLALGLHSLCYRRGEELKWFSPSVFIYLASVVPAIWVLELDAKRNEILCIYVDIGPLHLFKLLGFELLAHESCDLSQAGKKIIDVKGEQIHKMTTFDCFE